MIEVVLLRAFSWDLVFYGFLMYFASNLFDTRWCCCEMADHYLCNKLCCDIPCYEKIHCFVDNEFLRENIWLT